MLDKIRGLTVYSFVIPAGESIPVDIYITTSHESYLLIHKGLEGEIEENSLHHITSKEQIQFAKSLESFNMRTRFEISRLRLPPINEATYQNILTEALSTYYKESVNACQPN